MTEIVSAEHFAAERGRAKHYPGTLVKCPGLPDLLRPAPGAHLSDPKDKVSQPPAAPAARRRQN